MNVPFDLGQTVTLLTAFATAVAGYAELKLTVRDLKIKVSAQDAIISVLQADKTGAALLAQAVTNLSTDVKNLEGEMSRTRRETSDLKELFARIDERLKMTQK